jgi:hypothetical protein
VTVRIEPHVSRSHPSKSFCHRSMVHLQLGGLGILRSVAGASVAEEAKTRGFASPAFAGFAFVGVVTSTVVQLRACCLWGTTRCDVGETLTHGTVDLKQERYN